MKREILVNAGPRETRVAIIEDDLLVELLVDRPDSRRMVGDVYLGKVEAVLPGLQAAFVNIGTEKAAFLHAADVVVEVLSPDDSHRRIAQKIREYFAAGVRLVWVADSDDRTVTVYTRPGDGIVLWSDATLTGGDVLPDFTCPVANLFESI